LVGGGEYGYGLKVFPTPGTADGTTVFSLEGTPRIQRLSAADARIEPTRRRCQQATDFLTVAARQLPSPV
jgi:hypothetical protein